MANEPTIEALKILRTFIIKHRWGKEYYEQMDRDGKIRYCTMGAYYEVSLLKTSNRRALRQGIEALRQTIGTPNIPLWQDQSCIKKKDVIEAIDKTIERLEKANYVRT